MTSTTGSEAEMAARARRRGAAPDPRAESAKGQSPSFGARYRPDTQPKAARPALNRIIIPEGSFFLGWRLRNSRCGDECERDHSQGIVGTCIVPLRQPNTPKHPIPIPRFPTGVFFFPSDRDHSRSGGSGAESEEMIELHQFRPAFGILNASPFCMKVEVYLRMLEIEYKVVTEDRPNGPKGKLPYIVESGKTIADSSDILSYLAETRGSELDQALTPEQLGQGTLVQRTLEEHFYYAMLYFRWIDSKFWPTLKKAFFAHLPPGLSMLVPWLVRKGVRQTLHRQGLGRHSRDEILARARQDIGAVASVLGENDYLLGSEPSSYDACAFAFLANCAPPVPTSALSLLLEDHSNLLNYCARMKKSYLED